MSDLASDLRQYADGAATITLDEVSSARRPRPRRRRALVIGAVCCCVAATTLAIVATRNPAHPGVRVAGAPEPSVPSDIPSATTLTGGTAPSIRGTVTLEGWHSGPLEPRVTLPLGTTALLHATIRNTSDHSMALVHDGAAVFALTCDNGRLDADPAMGPHLFPFASTYTDPGGTVNITPPLAAGQSFSTSTSVTGQVVGTMTCEIVVNSNGGWSPIDPPAHREHRGRPGDRADRRPEHDAMIPERGARRAGVR